MTENPEQFKDDIPPGEEFDDEEIDRKPKGELRTLEEMRGELRGFIEMHELPNRIKLSKRAEIFDIDGNPISSNQTPLLDPREGVKMRGETIYAKYGDEQGKNFYWVKIRDADLWASRAHGYTKARP